VPKFSKSSNEKKRTCHMDLQKVLNEAIKYYDFTVVCGTRGEKEQNEAVKNGYSQVSWPNGKHNKFPSLAVDIAPYPIDWEGENRFCILAGVMKTVAQQLGIEVRWGGDWKHFKDSPHWELVSK